LKPANRPKATDQPQVSHPATKRYPPPPPPGIFNVRQIKLSNFISRLTSAVNLSFYVLCFI
jgi:hypothetical protein